VKRFPSIEKLDSAILYILELASSLSIILLAFGLIASMANVLTKGGVLSDNLFMQSVWAWTQCIAIDASVAGTIIRVLEYRANKEHMKMWLYAVLSGFLLFTAAIVSNIESVQQTLNITLEKAYLHVFIPVELLIWIRSVSIVLLIVAHAVRHVGTETSHTTQMVTHGTSVQEEKDEQPNIQETIVTPQEQAKALPAPKRERVNTNNYERVKAYMTKHPDATSREIGAALSMSPSTANKWMQRVRRE
jgi:hypothetical protein